MSLRGREIGVEKGGGRTTRRRRRNVWHKASVCAPPPAATPSRSASQHTQPPNPQPTHSQQNTHTLNKTHTRAGGGDDRKFLSRDEEPEEYWSSKGERAGSNPLSDPLAVIGILAIFFPFFLLLLAVATGYIDLSVYK